MAQFAKHMCAMCVQFGRVYTFVVAFFSRSFLHPEIHSAICHFTDLFALVLHAPKMVRCVYDFLGERES